MVKAVSWMVDVILGCHIEPVEMLLNCCRRFFTANPK